MRRYMEEMGINTHGFLVQSYNRRKINKTDIE